MNGGLSITMQDTVLTMRGIYKSFPGVRALQNVDFTLCEGEIHALMGENGAGKSTLIKVLTGVYSKDAGEICIKGISKPHIKSPQEAQKLGISTVYQEITLCPNLTVAENLFILFVNWEEEKQKCRTHSPGAWDTGKACAAAVELLDSGSADGGDCTCR